MARARPNAAILSRGRARSVLFLAVVLATAGASALAYGQAIDPTGVISTYYPSFIDRLRAQTALEMIRRLPNFIYQPTGEGAGIDSHAGNVLINGKHPAVEGAATLDEVLRRIPASQVVSINIIRGGAGGVDMRDRTVLADITVRPSASFRGAWTLSSIAMPNDEYGGTARFETQRRRDSEVMDFSLDLQDLPTSASNVLRERFTPDGTRTTSVVSDSGSRSERVELRGGYDTRRLGGRVRVNLASLYSSGDNIGREVATAGEATTSKDSVSQNIQRHDEGTLRYGRELAKGVQLESRLFHQTTDNESRSFSNGGHNIFRSMRETVENLAVVSIRHARRPRLTVEAGLEGGQTKQGGSSSFLVDGQPNGPQSFDARNERTRGLAYVNGVWKQTPTLQIDGALRVEATRVQRVDDEEAVTQDYVIASPRLGVTWNPDKQSQFALSLDRQTDPISLENYIATLRRNATDDADEVVGGASDLVPEKRYVVQAQYSKRWGKLGLFSVTASHATMLDIVDRVFLPGPGTTFFEAAGNIGDGRRDSAIVALETPFVGLGGGDVLVRLRATWKDSSITDPITGEERPLSGEVPFEWEAKLSHDFTDGRVRLGVDLSGGADAPAWRPFEVSATERDPNVQVYAEYRARPDTTLRAELRNVTDRDTLLNRTVYGPGGRRDGVLSYLETRDTRTGQSLYVNLRRTF
jgi:hypothetical protein